MEVNCFMIILIDICNINNIVNIHWSAYGTDSMVSKIKIIKENVIKILV